MTEFSKISRQVRALAIANGIVKTVAENTGADKSTVSRIFAGEVCTRPNPEVVAALDDFIQRMLSDEGNAA